MFQRLDPEKVLSTVRQVRQRVAKVFPSSGLLEVSGEVAETAEELLTEGNALRKPLWTVRCLITAGVLILLAIPICIGASLQFSKVFETLADFMQAMDAGFNVIILLTGSIIFLVSVEARMKRNRALRALNKLRSLAHVIDMHQLSKDPGMGHRVFDDEDRLRNRPPCIRSERDLWLYLSFCSDLLALLGKLAAWHAELMSDRAVLQTVNGIENLCSDTARKIWQKMSFLKMPNAEDCDAILTSASEETPSHPEVPAA